MKVVSGHQPAYLPWLGLIHKASLADVFIYMDDVQYLEKDWNNRNRIKVASGKAVWLTVPVNLKGSESKILKDIRIAEAGISKEKSWQGRHWKSLSISYGKAPYFKKYKDFFEWLYLENKWEKLTDLNLAILKQVFSWFDIKTKLIIASTQSFKKKKSDLVLEHGLRFDADIVVTGIQGKNYIGEEKFSKQGIKVIFQQYNHPAYKQRFEGFVSHLSFVDLLFNCGPDSRGICLNGNIKKEDICKEVLSHI